MKRLLLLLLFATGTSGFGADSVPFTRQCSEPDLTPGTRRRAGDRVLLYPETQYKYGLFQNFTGTYIDRPLFFNRALRPERFAFLTADSLFRDFGIMRSYGFDGSGSLSTALFNLYKQVNKLLDTNPERAVGHLEFPQFSFGEMGSFSAGAGQLDRAREVLRIALKSSFAPKINGRVPISSYNSGYIAPAVMRKFLGALRTEFGDRFAVTGGLVIDASDHDEFSKSGKWSEITRQKYRVRMTELLNTFDGIQLPLCRERRTLDYMTEPDFSVYDFEIRPLLSELLKSRQYQGKLVAAVVNHGYINHMSGVTQGEFGTARLRGYLDRLVKLNPDMVIFFEWNEFNENTCFQPTLYNSLALQRLVRYYAGLLKGGMPEPNPGDNPSVPPLILSHRETLKTGERLQFELLNVPDTLQSGKYRAQLSLVSLSGKVLVALPEENFDRAKLRAVTFSLPSEALSEEFLLLPRLKVTADDGKTLLFDNFQTIRLLPSFCRNYKTVRQPLRDLLLPGTAAFTAEAEGKTQYRLRGDWHSSEKIISLEVTDWGRDFFAAESTAEFDFSKCDVIAGTLSTRQTALTALSLQIPGVSGWTFRPAAQPNISFGPWTFAAGEMKSKTLLWAAPIRFLLTVPKTANNAQIMFRVDHQTLNIPLNCLRQKGKIAQLFQRCRLDWEIVRALPDIPPALDRRQMEFDVVRESASPYPVFQLRGVSASGKIYRGVPVMPRKLPPELARINVFSETTGLVQEVRVPAVLLPDIRYLLDPARGAMLSNSAHPFFDAQLGGGFVYDEAFHAIEVPPGPTTPEYEETAGGLALRFSGTSYINFPVETFPRGSFSLAFEIKPDAERKPYVLFRHYGRILGSVTVFVKYDRLYLAFGDRMLQTRIFPTGLEVTPDKWSRIAVSCDLRQIVFRVNGRERRMELANPLLALYFKPAIFGGHTRAEFGLPNGAVFFRGLMRNLEINHNAVGISPQK